MSYIWDLDLEAGWATKRNLVKSLSRTDIARYAGASGDVNTVHIDEPFAIEAGHPSVIAHGMHTMGMVGSLVSSLVGHQTVRRFGGRFLATVHPGDALDCEVSVREIISVEGCRLLRLEVFTTNGRGDLVFKGEAEAIEPAS